MVDIVSRLEACTGIVAFEVARLVVDKFMGIKMLLLELRRSQRISLNPLRSLKPAGMDFQ
jgi:hypothetical protein